MDNKQKIIEMIHTIEDEYLLKIIYKFLTGLLD